MMAGFSGHEKTIANHHDWVTPKFIVDALGPFDLDPCKSLNQPWDCAKVGYTVMDDGLSKAWFGVVWMNPPYGKAIEEWIRRLAEHGNGIGLMFARTDTRWFQNHCRNSSGMLFLRGRVRFHDGYGKQFDRAGGGACATSPSVLVAFGDECGKRLQKCGLDGMLVTRSKEDEERCAVVIADGEVVGAVKKAPDTDESSGTEEDE